MSGIRHLCLVLLTLVSCHVLVHGQYDKASCDPGAHDIPNVDSDDVAPDTFYVEWSTTASDNSTIVLEVVREWSPNGVDRFYKLVQDNYYNCAAFFRVVPGKKNFCWPISHISSHGPSLFCKTPSTVASTIFFCFHFSFTSLSDNEMTACRIYDI